MNSVKSQGYIPAGGVWTAEERADAVSIVREHRGHHYDFSNTIEPAANTVSALIAALEDMRKLYSQTGDHLKGDHAGQDCPMCNARALLDSLK